MSATSMARRYKTGTTVLGAHRIILYIVTVAMFIAVCYGIQPEIKCIFVVSVVIMLKLKVKTD